MKKKTFVRPVKRAWCWVVGHTHQAAGDYSMCWRCGHIKRVPGCFGSNPSWQTQAESDCRTCRDRKGCIAKSKREAI